MPFSEEEWYGCIFCRTGQELKLAETAQLRWPGLQARAVCAMKRRSKDGKKSIAPEVIMPGYIFYRANDACAPSPPLPEGMLRILTAVDGGYALAGQDAWFARWLLEQDGVIGVSQACSLNDRIYIQQGPLKDLHGSIIRIDRRNRNAQVQLEANGIILKVWLPFEYMESDVELKQLPLDI